jgi:hypothetical protein
MASSLARVCARCNRGEERKNIVQLIVLLSVSGVDALVMFSNIVALTDQTRDSGRAGDPETADHQGLTDSCRMEDSVKRREITTVLGAVIAHHRDVMDLAGSTDSEQAAAPSIEADQSRKTKDCVFKACRKYGSSNNMQQQSRYSDGWS